jgi:hypothetical protein
MMPDNAIDKSEFAKNAVQRGLLFGVNSHYLIAVAQLRSGITRGEENGKIGPFRYTQEFWDANNSFPDLELSLQPADIKSWRKQTTFAGVGALRSQERLLKGSDVFPSALQLYKDQFPDDPDGLPGKLQTAVDETRDLYLAAVDAVAPAQAEAIDNPAEPPPGAVDHPPPVSSGGQFGTLLNFIGKAESNNNYNAYFRHANNSNNPELVSKSVNEILAFQDQFVAAGSPSSAAGKYQIIRQTLRRMVQQGKVAGSDPFNQETQDKLAVELMRQRQLNDFLAGTLDRDDFAVKLAMEWASMPVPKAVTRKDGRTVHPGQSYYAGDSLNKALVTVEAFRAAIDSAKA